MVGVWGFRILGRTKKKKEECWVLFWWFNLKIWPYLLNYVHNIWYFRLFKLISSNKKAVFQTRESNVQNTRWIDEIKYIKSYKKHVVNNVASYNQIFILEHIIKLFLKMILKTIFLLEGFQKFMLIFGIPSDLERLLVHDSIFIIQATALCLSL